MGAITVPVLLATGARSALIPSRSPGATDVTETVKPPVKAAGTG